MEGKVTVYMNVTQKKNTRIDISSGELNPLVFRIEVQESSVSLSFSSFSLSCCPLQLLLFCVFFLSGSGLNDGQWHSVHLNAVENYAMLTVDGDEASTIRTAIPIQIQTGGTYYFGGGYSKR